MRTISWPSFSSAAAMPSMVSGRSSSAVRAAASPAAQIVGEADAH
jgi:hypothetical protein